MNEALTWLKRCTIDFEQNYAASYRLSKYREMGTITDMTSEMKSSSVSIKLDKILGKWICLLF